MADIGNKAVAPLRTTGYGDRGYTSIQPLDRPDLQIAAQRGFGLANVAFRLADVAPQHLTREAVRYAEVEGAKSGESRDISVVSGPNGAVTKVTVPKFTKAEGTGAMAEAWNRSALNTFALRMDTMTMGTLAEIELRHVGDPEGMTRELAAFGAGVKQELPPEMIERFDHDLMRLSRPMIVAATQARIKKTAEDQALASKLYAQSIVGTIVANASREGAAGIMGTVVNAEIMQGFVDQAMSRIDGVTYSAVDAGADTQNVIRTAVPGIIQAQFVSAPNREAWLASFLNGEAAIQVPHVDWKTGKVTPGVYDTMALTTLVDQQDLGALINGMQTDIRAQRSEDRAARAEALVLSERSQNASVLRYVAQPTPENFQAMVSTGVSLSEITSATSVVQSGGLGVQPGRMTSIKEGVIYEGEVYNPIQLASQGLNYKQTEEVLKLQNETADVMGKPEFRNARTYVDTAIGGFIEGMVFLPSNQQTELQRQTATQLNGRLLELSVDYQRQGYTMTNDTTITVDEENKRFSPLGIVKAAETQVNTKIKQVDTQIGTLDAEVAKITEQKKVIQDRVDKGEEQDGDLEQLDQLDRRRREIRQGLRQLQNDRETALRDIVEGMR